MDLSKRTINILPLASLWTEKEEFDAKRGKYLSQVEISGLLRKGPIQFVIANPGDKPVWKEVAGCYKMYKAEFKHHIIDDVDHIDLEHFTDNFGYVASLWDGNFKTPVVLLEKIH